MSITKSTSIIALAIGLSFAVPAMAQNWGEKSCGGAGSGKGMSHSRGNMGMGGMGDAGGMMAHGKCMSSITLSDTQKEQMQALWDQQNMDTTIQESIDALMTEPTFDEARAKELIAQRQAAMQNNQLEKLKKHYQMYQILTPEQKATLTECKNSMRDQRNNNKQ